MVCFCRVESVWYSMICSCIHVLFFCALVLRLRVSFACLPDALLSRSPPDSLSCFLSCFLFQARTHQNLIRHTHTRFLWLDSLFLVLLALSPRFYLSFIHFTYALFLCRPCSSQQRTNTHILSSFSLTHIHIYAQANKKVSCSLMSTDNRRDRKREEENREEEGQVADLLTHILSLPSLSPSRPPSLLSVPRGKVIGLEIQPFSSGRNHPPFLLLRRLLALLLAPCVPLPSSASPSAGSFVSGGPVSALLRRSGSQEGISRSITTRSTSRGMSSRPKPHMNARVVWSLRA